MCPHKKSKGVADKLVVVLITAIVFSIVISGTKIAAPSQQIKQFSSYDEMKSFVKNNVEASGMYSGITSRSMQSISAPVAEASSEKSADYSKTNVQVEGVDEADIVKSDGKYIYVVSGNSVSIIDAYPAENAKILSEINFTETPSEIFVNRDMLVVFGNSYASGYSSKMIAPEYYYSPKTLIYIYDISDRGNPVLAKNVTADGSYYDSRMIGDYVYAITSRPVNYGAEPQPIPLPSISIDGSVKAIPATEIYYFDVPDSSYIFTSILAINTQDTGEDVASKTFLMGYAQTLYASAENVYIIYEKRVNAIKFMDRIVDEAIVPSVPLNIQLRIKEAQSANDSAYERFQAVGKIVTEYLETLNPEQRASVMLEIEQRMAVVQGEIAKETEKTVIHKIGISGREIEYKTQGEVPGRALNQFSMDEHDGYFRIATTTSGNNGVIMPMAVTQLRGELVEEKITDMSAPPQLVIAPPQPSSQNHVYILDSSLQIAGKIEDLAPGERIYSVRFMGDRGYMVTFRQVDPLFVIDMNPAGPRVLGYLKIPGVSDYLHPYDENHVIGVGRDATKEGRVQGMKLSLFDVTDVSAPKEISKHVIGKRGTYSEAIYDHKAFMFSKEKNLLVIPVTEILDEQVYKTWAGAYVFGVDLNGFELKGRVTHDANQTGDYYYGYNTQIRRSLYIGDVLYTISSSLVKMNSLSDLSEINSVTLPAYEPIYRIMETEGVVTATTK